MSLRYNLFDRRNNIVETNLLYSEGLVKLRGYPRGVLRLNAESAKVVSERHKKVERTEVDNFQPIAIVKVLREKMREVRGNSTLSDAQKDNIRLGLAWAIAEIMDLATAKDRFTVE